MLNIDNYLYTLSPHFLYPKSSFVVVMCLYLACVALFFMVNQHLEIVKWIQIIFTCLHHAEKHFFRLSFIKNWFFIKKSLSSHYFMVYLQTVTGVRIPTKGYLQPLAVMSLSTVLKRKRSREGIPRVGYDAVKNLVKDIKSNN